MDILIMLSKIKTLILINSKLIIFRRDHVMNNSIPPILINNKPINKISKKKQQLKTIFKIKIILTNKTIIQNFIST